MLAVLDAESAPDSTASFSRTMSALNVYWRCCAYVAVASWLILGFLFRFLARNVFSVESVILIAMLGLAPSFLWLYIATYRIVLNEHGLARRRLWIWTHWPWEDFAAGKVQRVEEGCTLTHLERNWWDRWLVPGLLPSEDVAFLVEWVDQLSPPKPPDQSAEQPVHEVRLRWQSFLQELKVNQTGCELVNKGTLVSWDEIMEFRLQHRRKSNENFFRLFVTTAAGACHSGLINDVAWNEKQCHPRYTNKEHWLEALRALVPARCWKLYREQGELTSMAEGEFRLKCNDDEHKATWIMDGAAVIMLLLQGYRAAFVIIDLWIMPFLPLGWRIVGTACLLAGILGLPVTVIIVTSSSRRRLRLARTEIERQIAELSAMQPLQPVTSLAG